MKRFVSILVVAIMSHVSFSQSITTVTPSNADVGQGLEVSITCSDNSLFFCTQLQSWSICDTLRRVYFQQGDSIREPYKILPITGYRDSTVVVFTGFPLSSPTGAWDVVIEKVSSDTMGGTIKKIVKTGGFTINALSTPVIDSIRPGIAYQGKKAAFDIIGRHSHFKIARKDSLVNNISAIGLTRGASSIQADSFSIESCTKVRAYFTLKNSADTGLFNIKVDQGNSLPSAVLQNAVSIKPLPASPYSLPDGCVAFYPFEGDAVDRSYNGNNGAISGAVTVDGMFGQALYFNGGGSSVSVPNSPSLTVTSGLSISAWVKSDFDSVNFTEGNIVLKGSNNWNLRIYMYNSIDFYLLRNGGFGGLGFNPNNLHFNGWNHILVTWDGAVVQGYINGVLQSETSQLSPPIDNTADPLTIGGYFKGIIDEVMIFNRGLSVAGADSIYTGKYLGTVGSIVPSIIPYAPKVTLEQRPKFAWHPLAGATSYTLSVATDATFSTIVFQMPLSDTTFTPSVNLPIGHIYWHVKSDPGIRWSLADNFVIQSDTIPFIHRFNGATLNSRRPAFVWNKVALAKTYKIEVASNSLFINPYLTTAVGDTTFTPLGDLHNGVSYWHVSCDRNVSLFCEPDSLVITSKTYTTKRNSPLPTTYSCVVKSISKRAVIDYSLPATSAVSIKLYSLQGKLLKELPSSSRQPGMYESYLDISDFSRGYYIVDFKAGVYCLTKRIANF